MEHLPAYIYITFGLTVTSLLAFFYLASNKSITALSVIVAWLTLQAIIGATGFYTFTKVIPPRFPLLIFPPIMLILSLFITHRGRQFIDTLDVKLLTILHIIRIPIELVLLWLSLYKFVPVLMTFEGRNFDILSGLTAPLIYYFGFVKKNISKTIILIWNFICLALLLNVVVNAVLSTPTPMQQFAFDCPNVAILYLPFVLLPSLVVPIVLFSHLATIRRLWSTK